MGCLDDSARLAKIMLALRVEQDTVLGMPIARTYAWDIVLVLYVADAEGRSLTGREAISASGTALEVGCRYLNYLASGGIIIGEDRIDPDQPITLAPAVLTHLEGYLSSVLDRAR